MGKLRIMGCEYECKTEGSVGEGEGIASSSHDFQTISFVSGIKDEMLEKTIIHEIIEIAKNALCIKLKHDDIDRLDAVLFEALTANGVDLAPLRRAVKGE